MVFGSEIYWWIASLAVGAGSIPLAWVIVELQERLEKNRRPANGPVPIHMPRATVPSDLAPLIRGLAKAGVPFKGGGLWIFGGDGRHIVNNKRFRKQLRKWSRMGLNIRCVLVDADPDVQDALVEVEDDIGAGFDAVVINDGSMLDITSALGMSHPALFFGADGRNAAWIEGSRRGGSIYACDVIWVSPLVMERRPGMRSLFLSYKKQFELIAKNTRPLTSRDAHAATG